MPQSTNLNRNPYYDDFSDSKNFYKVLFKPGVSVQTRELTTLQSILQNQIEKLGGAFFKKNSVVVPGGFAYDSSFYAVEVEKTYKGIDVESYFENLVGKTLTGRTSNVTAKVEKVLSREESSRSNTTFYIKYQTSSSQDFSSSIFSDGEELVVNEDINLGTSSLLSGSAVAKTISPTNRTSTSVGSAAKIDDGVYFIRGFFVNISKDVLVLDQYTNSPSYRVGLNINEQIVGVNDDSSLYDNAQGFSNYAAPGADRLKISLSLTKKSLTDFNDENFIELFRVENGNLIQIKNETENSFLEDILARRTFDESGNYYVNAFNVEALESLNNNLGNGGIYSEGQTTSNNITSSKDTAVIKVSPGKAYVKGYEVPTKTELLNLPKPRTTKRVESSSSAFSVGNLIRVNNVRNTPNIGLTTSGTISLYDQRLTGGVALGTTIGLARVYDVSSRISSYQDPSSEFNLNLFDIQTYGTITSDSDLSSVGIGTYIKGESSGATGFIKDKSGTTLTIYQNSGTFISNESLILNGIGSTISIGTFRNYSIEDIKSISDGTFSADTVLSQEIRINGPFSLEVESGIGTIRADNGSSFASNLKVSDVIKFSRPGVGSDIYAPITFVGRSKKRIVIGTSSDVINVCSGDIGVTTSLSQFSVIRPQIIQSDDSSLTSRLNNTDIANVDFENSSIYVRVINTGVSKSGTTLTLPSLSGTDYVYSTYDSERYTIVNADGSIENLDSDTAVFTISNGGKNGAFTGLSATAGPCKVISTQIKSNVTQKFKELSRCNSITISNTKYATPLNDGLTFSTTYGTRVEDDQISLNTSDIVSVQAIFESSTSSDPTIPYIRLSSTSLNSPNSSVTDLIVGEIFVGEDSGAVGVYAGQKEPLELYVINKNNNSFIIGETITFSESKYTATIENITSGDKNILDTFILDNGQRPYFYDFGRIIRNNDSREPSGRLTVFFDKFTFGSTDYGDLVAVNSYPTTIEKNLIPVLNGVRNTDVLDIRPKVVDYSTNRSPFEFISREFTTSSNNSSQILSPNENFVFDYEFYLPRTDKLTLSKDGVFNIVLGNPNEVPLSPSITNEVLDIATIVSSPYVYDVAKDIQIILSDHRRYTMSDLRDIENRVSNLEFYSTLSLLELSTETLLITDSNGLNRFKSGFFVDEFNNYDTSDIQNPSYSALIENKTLSSFKNEEKINLSLYTADNYTSFADINLGDTTCSNLKITGSTLSLNYSEVEGTKQPFASKVVNINPFNIVTWSGFLELNPSKDTWTKQISITTGSGLIRRVETSVSQATYIRTRNLNFNALNLKPNTRFKLAFDKKDLTQTTLNSSIVPKLLEISDNIGSFQIGETVECLTVDGKISSVFRICSPNHKSGPINSPTLKYSKNPYNPSVGISSQYGTQSTFLNIDIDSLTREDISGFWGKISKGNKLVGKTSKATATVSDVRLVTNEEGVLIGSIWIDENDNFKTGQTTVDLTLNSPTAKVPGEVADSSASAVYTTEGTEITTAIRYFDPLSQTFLISDESGYIPTSVDVYFYTKDDSIPVTLEIREVSLGIPGGPDKVLLRKTLSSSQVNTSNNASTKTTFTFDKLMRLPAGEYAIVLLSDSDEYQVWISEIGKEDISTVNLSSLNKIFITKQPSLGTLFKSQNGTTWVPSPLEDLKFTLNKAKFITSGGTARFFNSTESVINPKNKLSENPITAISTSGNYPNDGRHILVFHPNHGMHSSNNQIQIRGVQSDILPVKLSAGYANTETGAISVASTSIFATFEGSNVSGANPGYIQIGNEIIKYENVGTGQLLDITRGQYGTISYSHNVNSDVYKYEFNNVSLNRINTEFTIVSNPKPTLDTYYVQVSSGSSFTQTKTAGGNNVYASRNYPFSELTVNSNFVTKFDDTEVVASVRTVSSTSVDGTEVSFVDKGYENIGINSTNVFDTPRMVASRINETTYLNSNNFIGNRSFTLELDLDTSNENVSPLIDLNQTFAVGSIYAINQPVGLSSYSSDGRVNLNVGDPHSFVHITNRVDLEQSANALQVLFSSYRNPASDIRVLYKIFTNDVPDDEQVWRLFPGYDNLDVNGNVINTDNNSGRSDSNVRSSLNGEYLDYRFSANDLPGFTGFQIKIVGTSSNQSYSPLIKELRAIAVK
jgi:hypothetical protein